MTSELFLEITDQKKAGKVFMLKEKENLLFTATTGSSYDVISMVEHGDTLSNYNLGDYNYSENKQ